MTRKRRTKARVVLCSYGLHWRQITLETLSALRRCDVVFGDAVDEGMAALLAPYCRRLELLEPLFKDLPPARVLEAKAERVVEEAVLGKTVAVLTYGHPTFLCSLTDRIVSLCEARGLAWEVRQAISSLGALLTTVGVRDIPGAGIRLYSACTLAGDTPPPDPRGSALVFDLQAAGVFPALAEWLARAYPPGHRVRLVRCTSMAAGSRSAEVPLERLEATLRRPVWSGATLYVPPAVPAGESKPDA